MPQKRKLFNAYLSCTSQEKSGQNSNSNRRRRAILLHEYSTGKIRSFLRAFHRWISFPRHTLRVFKSWFSSLLRLFLADPVMTEPYRFLARVLSAIFCLHTNHSDCSAHAPVQLNLNFLEEYLNFILLVS